jgi:hypothetical protein
MGASRNDSVSGYLPGFGGASGVKVRKNELKSQVIEGTIISAGVTYAVTHALGEAPALVNVNPSLVEGDAVTTVSAGVVGEADASAATTTKIYVIGNKDGIKYKAFLLV